MKSIEDIAKEQSELSSKRINAREEGNEKVMDRAWVIGLVVKCIDRITKSLFKVEVTNEKDLEPAIKSVENAVKQIPETKIPSQVDPRPELKRLLDAISALNLVVNVPEVKIPDNKKELLSIDKSVRGIKFPEIKVEKTEVDFSKLSQDVLSVKNSVDSLGDVLDKKTQEKPPKELTELSKSLSKIEQTLKNILNKPEIQIPGNSDILDGLNAVKEQIANIKFPVPTLNVHEVTDAIEHLEGVLSGEINVDVDVSTLATEVTLAALASEDFATETTLATMATETTQLNLLTELEKKADLTETQPVSAATLPLPTGAATSSNQTDGSQKTKIVTSGGVVVDTFGTPDGATETTLAKTLAPTGTDTDNSVTMTSSGTAYALPASAPTSAYVLTIYNTHASATIYVRRTTGTTLGFPITAGGSLDIDLGANKTIFAYSATAGVVVNCTYAVK